jgi:PAS domain S-box-containing protein
VARQRPGWHRPGTQYRVVFEQSRDAIFMADASGNMTAANQAALDLLGCGREDLAGRSFSER